jgi:Tfp pilus assembly PilM family ATPase
MAIVVGIDLGSHATKLALMEGRLGRVELLEYRVRTVPQDGSKVPTLADRLAACRELFEEDPSLATATCMAAYPGQHASLHRIRLPFSDRTQIAGTLAFELEGHVPFDLDDYVLDYRVGESDIDGHSESLCALADRRVLGPLLEGLQALGGDPRQLSLDAEVLGERAPETGTWAVVDIGHTRTLVAVVRDGELVTGRTITRGGRDLTLALAEKWRWDWGTAEGAKHIANLRNARRAAVEEWEDEGRTDPAAEPSEATPNLAEGEASLGARVSHAEVATTLITALEPLVAELRATLFAVEIDHGAGLDGVLLTGGSAALEGLQEWLERQLGWRIRAAQISDEAEALGMPGRFALAQTLAGHAAGVGRARTLDFRKADFVYRGDMALTRTIGLWAMAALVLASLAGTAWFGFAVAERTSRAGELEDEIVAELQALFPEVSAEKGRDPSTARAIVVEKTAAVEERVELLGATIGDDPPILTLLRDLSNSMPPPADVRIEVSELNLSSKAVRFTAKTDSYDSVARIESSLQENERFRNARKGDEKKLGDGIKFTMTIPLGEDDIDEEDG